MTKSIKQSIVLVSAAVAMALSFSANARTVPATESNYAAIELDILKAQSANKVSAPVADTSVKTSNRPTAEEDHFYRGNSH